MYNCFKVLQCSVFSTERYVASACEPPAVSVYPVSGAATGAGAGAGAGHNPWEREQREIEAAARRAAARARRSVYTTYKTYTAVPACNKKLF